MNCATKRRRTQILVWLIWAITCLVLLLLPVRSVWKGQDLPALPGALLLEQDRRILFPWLPRERFRKWAWRNYCRLRRAYQRALWATRLARLAAQGAFSIARLVDLLTEAQVRQHLGALPVLYALLETLQVRTIINRHCATRAKVDHGTVALVLVLNRLTMPLPLYQIADWMARTVLVARVGIPARKFNDDRLGRTLDALAPHCQQIWQVSCHAYNQRAKSFGSIIFDMVFDGFLKHLL